MQTYTYITLGTHRPQQESSTNPTQSIQSAPLSPPHTPGTGQSPRYFPVNVDSREKRSKTRIRKVQIRCADMTATIKKLQSQLTKLTKVNSKLQAEIVKLKCALKHKQQLQKRYQNRLYKTKNTLLRTRLDTRRQSDHEYKHLRQCNTKQASLIKQLQADLQLRDDNCAELEDMCSKLEQKLKPSIPHTKEGQVQ